MNETGVIVIKINGKVCEPSFEEHEAVAVEMWYDRHYRHWVLYPIDAEGNQLVEAKYGFGKKEALAIKKDLETEYNI